MFRFKPIIKAKIDIPAKIIGIKKYRLIVYLKSEEDFFWFWFLLLKNFKIVQSDHFC